jgi:hypothetical protein
MREREAAGHRDDLLALVLNLKIARATYEAAGKL